jgi:Flp pilus assembly protein TadD
MTRIYHIARALSRLEDAYTSYQKGNLNAAVKFAREAVALGPNLPETYYDLACYLSLAGELDQAMESIATAIHMAPRFKSMAAGDSDLKALRSRPKFQELVK